MKVDSILVFSYKIYGLKGVGMVYMNLSFFWKFIYYKVIYEKGFCFGIVNIMGIVVFIVVVECVYVEMKIVWSYYECLKLYLLENLEFFVFFIEVEGFGNFYFFGIMGLMFLNI